MDREKEIEQALKNALNAEPIQTEPDYVCEIGLIIKISEEPTKLFAVIYLNECGVGITGIGVLEVIKTESEYSFNDDDVRYLDADELVGAKNVDKIDILMPLGEIK